MKTNTIKKNMILLSVTALLMTSCTTPQAVPGTMSQQKQSGMTPDLALAALEEGNERFAAGKSTRRNLLAQAKETSKGQYPFASVVSCVDSRTSSEIIFDQGLGDIFNARVAGNVINPDIIGSLEFTCKVAGSKLIVVVGHTSCGAVKGACDHVRLGSLTGLLAKIRPAVDSTPPGKEGHTSSDGTFVNAVAETNVRLGVKAIRSQSPILRQMEKEGALRIVGAMHDLETGRVRFLN